MRIRNTEVEIGTLAVGAKFRFSGQVDDNKLWEVEDRSPRHVKVLGRPVPYPFNLMVIPVY